MSAELGSGTPPALEEGVYELELPSGIYTKTDWGDFDGDGQEDVVFLRDDHLDVMLAPGMLEALMRDLTGVYEVHDFAVVRGDVDKLLTVGPGGLLSIEYDETLAVAPLFEYWRVETLESDLWDGALFVDVWSDGVSPAWVAGIQWNGRDIVSTRLDGLTPTTLQVTESYQSVRDAVLFDHDGDGTPELGYLTASALAVYDPFGTATELVFFNASVDHLDTARLRRDGSPLEWLALLGTMPNGTTQFLSTLGAGVFHNSQLVGAGRELYALSSGRIDADGFDDLVLAGTGQWDLFRVVDTSGLASAPPAFDFDANNVVTITTNGNASAQKACAIIVDVDHDSDGVVEGDGDIVYPLQSTNKLHVVRSPDLPHEAHLPKIDMDYGCASVGGYLDELDVLRLRVLLPDTSLRAEYVEFIAWVHDDTGDGQTLKAGVTQAPCLSERHPITTPSGDPSAWPDWIDLEIPIDCALDDGEWAYSIYLALQMVDAPNLTGTQTNCLPGQIVVLSPTDVEPVAPHGGTFEFDIYDGTPEAPILPDGTPLQCGTAATLTRGTGPGAGSDAFCVPAAENRPPARS